MVRDKRITVFTPTFNRAYILSQLYESLKKQTNQSFLWLIVDDGSTDNTKELIDMWLVENIIEIRYYKQENGGKQRAHNKGVELCDTELFICVDSDDYLTEDAVELLITTWDNIQNKENISGIVGLAGENRSTPIGTNMPTNIKSSTLNDLYNRHGFRGDTALLYKTEILKQFPFYVVEGENFIGEGYVYLQIDQNYSLFLLDRIIYICKYLEDGYTTNVRRLIKNNPKGYMVLNKQSTLLSKTIMNRYKNSIKYMIGCILSKEKHPIKNAPDKGLALLAYPAAMLYCILHYR
ncbi:glycosyltransferase family 2 protein [Bacillus sp. NTK074B]|uniref:glycosyltransferase family 2 protein n=1 Tax=Bacillus sp. NTK074B TaxID=2802174 RepID=UPI001A902745|nr:glycosyltransferase family 2 protein [Bacillus sp. NTK074B]